MHVTASRLWIALVVAVLATAGCSRDPGKPYPVHGVILFEDGQPAKELAGGSVTFTPASEGALGSSIGGIGADGTFTLSCKRQADGAVAGKHRVTISLPEPEDQEGDNPKARRPRPKAIIDPATSIQEVTVEPRNNDLVLRVRRPKTGKN